MILIADSGSSKTAWSLIDDRGQVHNAATDGLNPLHTSKEDILALGGTSELKNWPLADIKYVYFYGAGVINDSVQKEVCERLARLCTKAKITAASDLLGAARAAFGNSSGIIGILGTGSNSGYYNGEKIETTIAPLGYILGDEGSGTALGKAFITQFLRNQLPENLDAAFREFYPDYDNLLPTIYTPGESAKILGSFVPFLLQHKDNPAIQAIVKAELSRYIQLLNSYDRKLPVALVGSVAYFFKEEITKFAQEEGLIIENIIRSPIERLTQYHRNS